jgi:hypothetical protein
MEVYVQKIKQTAQLEAERQLVQGKTEIEKSRAELIDLEQQNLKKRELGNAMIEAEAAIERAKGDAQSSQIRKNAENQAEIDKIQKIIETLKAEGGNAYIKLQQVLSFTNVDKTLIVPTDSKLFVPIGTSGSDHKQFLDTSED